METISLTTDAFSPGEPIPPVYTCDGDDYSPALAISGTPEESETLALIMDDPDAPGKTFVHWVLFNVPPDTTVLAENVDVSRDLNGAVEGTNDYGNLGYGGPCPPPGNPHRYYFRLYALDTSLDLEAGCTKKQLTQAMDGHVLAESELMGTYQRSR